MLPVVEMPFRAIDLPVELTPNARSEIVGYMRYITVTEAPILQTFWIESLQRRGISAVALDTASLESAQDMAMKRHLRLLLSTTLIAHNVDYTNMEVALKAAVLNGVGMSGELVPGGTAVTQRIEQAALKNLVQQANAGTSRRSLRVKYTLKSVEGPDSPPVSSAISHSSSDAAEDLWSECVDGLSEAITQRDLSLHSTPVPTRFAVDSQGVRVAAMTRNSMQVRGKSIDQLVAPAIGTGGSKLPKDSPTGKMYAEAQKMQRRAATSRCSFSSQLPQLLGRIAIKRPSSAWTVIASMF